MSVKMRRPVIACDNETCDREVLTGAANVGSARAFLRETGWHCRYDNKSGLYFDYCPDHWGPEASE